MAKYKAKITGKSLSIGKLSSDMREHESRSCSKRGQVSGFSRRARNRARAMTVALHEFAEYATTLDYAHTPALDEFNRNIAALRKAFTRRYPDSWLVMRIEPHSFGRPHLHLMVGQVCPEFPLWIQKKWASLTTRILKAGTAHTQQLDREGALKWANYICKPEDTHSANKLGDFWANVKHRVKFFGEQNLPIEKGQVEISSDSSFDSALDYLQLAMRDISSGWSLPDDEKQLIVTRRNSYIELCRARGCGVFFNLPENVFANFIRILKGEEGVDISVYEQAKPVGTEGEWSFAYGTTSGKLYVICIIRRGLVY